MLRWFVLPAFLFEPAGLYIDPKRRTDRGLDGQVFVLGGEGAGGGLIALPLRASVSSLVRLVRGVPLFI